MLHAKFQDHRTSGSREEDFLMFLPYSTASETFISFTLTNVEFRKSHDFFAWIWRGSSVGFAWN